MFIRSIPGIAILFSLVISFPIAALAGEITIKGNNPEYRGHVIELNTYKNQISGQESKISSAKVDTLGNFEFKFDVQRTEFVFAHVGVFFAYLFVEPGNSYEVKFPPFTPKKQDEKLNPFFEEAHVHLLVLSVTDAKDKIDSPEDLNRVIASFTLQFDSIYTEYAVKTYTQQGLKNLDSTINELQLQFDKFTNPYFRDYFSYRIGLLKFSTARLKSRFVSDNWFLNKPVLYDNPAYMELFNQVYTKYFVYFGRSKNGKKLYSDINTNSSFYQLKQTLAQDNVLKNDTLKELVILKGIYDGFYEMEFSRNSLLKILDSLIVNTKIEIHKTIGDDIRTKVTKLLVGYTPPAFKLFDLDNKLKTLESFKGSYIYLNFATTQNYACLKDLELLKRVHEKYGKYVTIVTISADELASSTRNYVKKKGYKWTFLHYGNQPDIIREYDIRLYPTYFLIDRQGKLVWSYGPSPSENFDTKLFEELRSKGIL